jgi:hypothetical protein
MARPVRSDYDNPGQFAQALREYEAANPTTPVAPTELPEYKDLAYQAAGYSGDTETADYIKALASGSLGGEADTKNALNILIQQGQARNLAERGNVEFYPGYDPGGRPEDTPVSNIPAVPVVDPVPGGTRADAKNTIRAVLSTYGLGELSDYLYGVYARGEVNINNPDAIIFSIREQDAYKKRFAANKARADKGLSELDPGSYIQLEDTFRRLMQSNGLPTGFYDQTDDFTKLIEGDVSPQELQDRVQNGFRAVQDADPEVKRQMQELYGVNEAGLAAYFLDPTKAAPILTRQAEAAKISARAKGLANLQLTALTAEELAARGITQTEAEAGFTKLGLQQGLYSEMSGEQALTQQQKVGAALGTDINAQTILEQRKGTRKSPFQGGGKFTSTTGQTSGTTESGLNVAQ